MKLPKMILFDYGNTLSYEPDFDGVRGNAALLRRAVKNKNNLTAAELKVFADTFFSQAGVVRKLGYELQNQAFERRGPRRLQFNG